MKSDKTCAADLLSGSSVATAQKPARSGQLQSPTEPATGTKSLLMVRNSSRALSFGNEFLKSNKLLPAHLTGAQQVMHHISQAALKNAIQQVVRHASRDRFCRDHCAIKETPAFQTMPHQGAGLHFSEHGRDGRICQVAPLIGQGLMDVGDSGFAAFPENLHDPKLQIAQTMNLSPLHRSITTVILPQ